MINLSGSLVFKDYLNFFKSKKIINNNFSLSQIQPSSVDLTLSEECYEINASFLSPTNYVRDNLKKIKIRNINLNKKYLFKKNKTFLIKLNETLNLKGNFFGICNPKSSTGRLDIFCRTILNYSDEYEKIPLNYKGEMFIEITSRSFDIEFQKGDSLNQMRLIAHKHLYVKDSELELFLLLPIFYYVNPFFPSGNFFNNWYTAIGLISLPFYIYLTNKKYSAK